MISKFYCWIFDKKIQSDINSCYLIILIFIIVNSKRKTFRAFPISINRRARDISLKFVQIDEMY